MNSASDCMLIAPPLPNILRLADPDYQTWSETSQTSSQPQSEITVMAGNGPDVRACFLRIQPLPAPITRRPGHGRATASTARLAPGLAAARTYSRPKSAEGRLPPPRWIRQPIAIWCLTPDSTLLRPPIQQGGCPNPPPFSGSPVLSVGVAAWLSVRHAVLCHGSGCRIGAVMGGGRRAECQRMGSAAGSRADGSGVGRV